MRTIVWDVDDVLNDLMSQWFASCWLPRHPECRLTFKDLKANPPDQVLDITRDEYLGSLDEFRKTEQAREMNPNPAVMEWFRKHGASFRHIALTARPLESAPDVAHWVLRHFGAWIRCIGFVHTRPNDEIPVYDHSKGEFLNWVRCGNIMVDDSTDNIKQAESLGLKGLLYPQPWNDSTLSIDDLLDELAKMAVCS